MPKHLQNLPMVGLSDVHSVVSLERYRASVDHGAGYIFLKRQRHLMKIQEHFDISDN